MKKIMAVVLLAGLAAGCESSRSNRGGSDYHYDSVPAESGSYNSSSQSSTNASGPGSGEEGTGASGTSGTGGPGQNGGTGTGGSRDQNP